MPRLAAALALALCSACGGDRYEAPPRAPTPRCAPLDAGAPALVDAGAPPADARAETPEPELAPASRAEAISALAVTLRDQITREAAAVPDGTALVFALVTEEATPPLLVAHGRADLEGKIPATPDTLFRIASVTKTFTAASILALRDAGALRLEDKVSRVLPELASVAAPHRDAPAITLRHLLLHAAGLPRSGPYAAKEPDFRSTEDEVLEAAQKLALDPGVRHSYSNLGYAVLGLAAGRVSNSAYRDVVERRLLGPLGMRATTFDETRFPPSRLARGYVERAGGAPVARAAAIANGAAEGAGGLWSSGSDLAKWVRFQLAAWPARDEADKGPLRRATLRESHTGGLEVELTSEAEGDALAIRARSQGLGWKVERSCAFEHLVEHGGDLGGYHARLWFAPQRGIGFVLLVNAGSNASVDAIARRTLATLAQARGVGPRDPGAAPPPLAAAGLRCVP